jgi:hypothetical protein
LRDAVLGVWRHALLDRMIRGRAALALVTFALIGIVTLQLGLLRLNSSIGRTLERKGVLQRENAALSIEDSELSATERVQAGAARAGMQTAPIPSLRFLAVRPGIDASRAAGALAAASRQTAASSEGGERSTAERSAGPTPEQGAGEGASGASQGESSPGAQGGAPTGTQGEPTSASQGEPAGASHVQSAGASAGESGAAASASGGSEATSAGEAQSGPSG